MSDTGKKNALRPGRLWAIMAAGCGIGIAGGAVRAVQLFRFDGKGLPFGPVGLHAAVWAVSAVQLAVAVVLWFAVRKKTLLPRAEKGLSPYRPLAVGSSVCFAVGAALMLAMSYRPFSVWGIVLAVVCFAACAALPIAADSVSGARPRGNSEKLISLVPVGAMVLIMIEIYRSVAKSPAPSHYAPEIFAAVALILLLFSCAGFVNCRTGAKKIAVTAFAALEFCITSVCGRLVSLAAELFAGAGAGSLVCPETFRCALFLGGIFAAAALVSAVVLRGDEAGAEAEPRAEEQDN